MVNCVGANSRKTELCPSAASKAQALQKAPSPRLLWLTAVIWGEGGRVESAPPVLCQRRKEVLVHSYEFCPLLSYCFFSQKEHGVKLISLLLFPQGCRNRGICLSHWGAVAWFTAWRRMSVRADLTRKKKVCILSQEIHSRAEALQTLHPFPPVVCSHVTAVPVLCSQLTLQMLLVVGVSTELVQRTLCLLAASLLAFHWHQLLDTQEPKVANALTFSFNFQVKVYITLTSFVLGGNGKAFIYLFLRKTHFFLHPSGRNDCVAYCGWERRAFAFHLIWSFHSLQLLNLVATGRSIDPEMGRTSLPCQMFFCCPHAIF